jgi:hypothetical protein
VVLFRWLIKSSRHFGTSRRLPRLFSLSPSVGCPVFKRIWHRRKILQRFRRALENWFQSREREKKALTTSPGRPYTKATIRLLLDYYSSIVYHGE